MELHPPAGLGAEGTAPRELGRYLEALPLDEAQRRALASRIAAESPRDALAALHAELGGEAGATEDPAAASIARRLELAYGAPPSGGGPQLVRDVRGRVRLPATPPLERRCMAPDSWPPALRLFSPGGRHRPVRRERWLGAAAFRRTLLLALVLAQTLAGTWSMIAVLPYHGTQPLEIAILALFAVLFGWVSAGFWTAMMGFVLLVAGRDRYAISASAAPDAPIAPEARSAVIMPICNENVARVFAGLRATYESVREAGALEHFDFFVLSDTSDPDTRVAEMQAWTDLARALGAFGRIYYRWRRFRIKRKSGNVADFCRRWGARYRYMVVLDADSVMSGACLARLVRLMEANPDAGIIQTAPNAAGRETLYARIQQFANRAYGPLFTAGLHFWQLGESHYWGHNAILRIAPFIEHCALGRLPGRGALAGEILSHDFVEAALMRRAGWAVLIAYDLPGSYEDMPPNLIDELKRDRRWAQGNLINSRLLLAQGLHPAHRAAFVTGVMAYLSAPLWFASLLLSTALLALHTLVPPRYFTQPKQLFPLWPEWHPDWALALAGATAALLFLPKLLAMVLLWARGARRYGGALRVTASVLAEMAVSALLAPIRMLFHTEFVAAALAGWKIQWRSPSREDAETSWREALARHGWHTLLGSVWAAGVYLLDPRFLWWLAPIVLALMLSMPISVLTSRVPLGRRLRKARLFLIPEETRPPKELRRMRAAYRRARRAQPGFVDAVVDPVTNALVCASGVVRTRPSAAARAERLALVERALKNGPEGLDSAQRLALLVDPAALSRLHFAVWSAPYAHRGWHTVGA
jgi:membrane glycosyltransferase